MAHGCMPRVGVEREIHRSSLHCAMDGLKRGLSDLDKFLAEVDNQDLKVDITKQQLRTWAEKLKSCPVSADEKLELAKAINALQNFEKDQKAILVKALADNVTTENDGASRMRPRQTCLVFGDFLTQDDLSVLKSDQSLPCKLDVVCARMVSIGLHLPQETTYGHILQRLVFVNE